MKVFLSHSSKQKSYVEQVASILGKENIVYDSWSFEEGNKTLDEIYKGIERSGVFTFFISRDSLSSDWVKKELFLAEKFIYENKIKKFVPIIIDSSLNHKSDEIPNWMKNYNIKYIHKPGRAAVRIKNELLSIYAETLPIFSKEEQLFIGRNDDKKEFEERYYSPGLEKPIVFVVNGLPNIGKRKFIKKVLTDSNIIEIYYKPIILDLDRRNSIEDLILNLYKLGYSREDESLIESMIDLSIDEKIDLCIRLINELSSLGEMLIILDNQFIFSKNGDCALWFINLVNKFKSLYGEGIKFCIASMARVREPYKNFEDNCLFNQTIKEFLKHERRAYFEQLLQIHNIELNQNDISDIIDCCSGIPAQIRFGVNLLKSGSYNISDCIQRIVEFNKNNSSVLIEEYEDDIFALQLLKLLSMGEFFSYSLIYSIFRDEDQDKIDSLLTSFNDHLIIEYVADGFEFIKLTDSVKDYIERRNYKLDEKYIKLIKDISLEISEKYNLLDSSEIRFYMKESIKLGMVMPSKYLIPSFYLNAMRELYNYEKRYSVVVKLANKVLEYEKNIDPKIIKEIMYWYCLSLARLKDPKIVSYVQKINSVEHNFILGFYYRIIGKNDKAIEKLKLVLDIDKSHSRAKGELVQVYINTEQYELAYNLAKQNYESDPTNPYNIQSYFKCLIKRDDIPEKDSILIKLLDSLKCSQHEKSDEMFSTSNAQYIAYIKNDYKNAIFEIDEAIARFPRNIYPYLVKLEIIRNSGNIDYEELEKTIREIQSVFNNKESDIFNKLIYIISEILIRKNYYLDKDSAETYFNDKVLGKFPDKTIESIKLLLD